MRFTWFSPPNPFQRNNALINALVPHEILHAFFFAEATANQLTRAMEESTRLRNRATAAPSIVAVPQRPTLQGLFQAVSGETMAAITGEQSKDRTVLCRKMGRLECRPHQRAYKEEVLNSQAQNFKANEKFPCTGQEGTYRRAWFSKCYVCGPAHHEK